MAKTAGFDSLNSFREYVLDDTRADSSVRTNTNRDFARKRVFSSLGYAGRSDTQNSTGVKRGLSRLDFQIERHEDLRKRATFRETIASGIELALIPNDTEVSVTPEKTVAVTRLLARWSG